MLIKAKRTFPNEQEISRTTEQGSHILVSVQLPDLPDHGRRKIEQRNSESNFFSLSIISMKFSIHSYAFDWKLGNLIGLGSKSQTQLTKLKIILALRPCKRAFKC
jgi:hypothetical protein